MRVQGVGFLDLLPREIHNRLRQFRGRCHDHDEPSPPGQHEVQRGPFQDRRLAVPARHGEREHAAHVAGRLDLGDAPLVVFAERPVKRFAAVVFHPAGQRLLDPCPRGLDFRLWVGVLDDPCQLARGLYQLGVLDALADGGAVGFG